MKIYLKILLVLFFSEIATGQETAKNPIIYADVPDMSMIRVENTYYMSSTTMHMNPGVPIMKSTDLINWELASYAYETLGNTDALNLESGENAYGKGSWASSLRYHEGTFYVSTFSSTTGKTYIFSTDTIESGKWKELSFKPSFHDNTLFFDDDGKIYMIYGGGDLKIVELKENLSGFKEGTKRTLITNASAPAGNDIALPAEGSQLFKVKGKYYLFNITWPKGGMRTVVVHRADKIGGPYEGRLTFQDKGVAQGGLIDTPDGKWFAYLFKDNGAVGRIPYLVPVHWENNWPVLGVNGKVPSTLNLPASNGLIPGIVNSDEFNREANEPFLPLVWQWNHNPDEVYWSVTDRRGYLRLTTNRLDSSVVATKNTLTQRTFGPICNGSTAVDIAAMKEGDVAGLVLLQEYYGYVGVQYKNGKKYIVQVNYESGKPTIHAKIPITANTVYLSAACNYREMKDTAQFYYSLDGKSWHSIGNQLKMKYTLSHFMGYRFGLFNYATKTTGGYADFNYFHIKEQLAP
ncbi:glycoside hydrolase 43 family protein [Galbibacter sp. PAP.153]|uniref:glycoside hydrolase family 43 protein n=1 Tax=Galbibacter sp. PAP.153 TaxID=3104623 RepID=UPI00300A7B82